MFFRTLNLFLAVCWLLVGISLLVSDWRRGIPTFYFTIGGTPVSLGWLALILAAYNLFRWWSIQWSLATRRRSQGTEQRRRHHRPAASEPTQKPDPNFLFTDQKDTDGHG